MSRTAASLAAVLLAALVVAAQEPAPPTTTTTAAPAEVEEPLKQSTEVVGTIPDLTGRWFAVADLAFQKNPARILVPVFWEVTNAGGTVDVQVRQVTVPPSVAPSWDKAMKERVSWTPTPADLDAIRDEWEKLPAEDKGLATLNVKLMGKDAFDDNMKNEPLMKDALWVAQTTGDFRRGGGRPVREVTILGANTQTEDGWAGNYMSVAVANAPFPVPIALNGTFRMWRVDNRPKAGILSRIGGWFAGCGRKP